MAERAKEPEAKAAQDAGAVAVAQAPAAPPVDAATVERAARVLAETQARTAEMEQERERERQEREKAPPPAASGTGALPSTSTPPPLAASSVPPGSKQSRSKQSDGAAPSDGAQEPDPAAAPVRVVGAAGLEYALPQSVLTALSGVPARPVFGDAVCQIDGTPLFYRWPVVRAARGYPEGQAKGVLLVCVRCLTPLNPGELLELAREPVVA